MTIAVQLGPEAKVCELGVKNGESLRMWQSLFPLGEITGVDNDPASVFPPRAKKVIASQDNPVLAELGPFDLIVDDASHEGLLTREAFRILWPRVSPGGFYVVEDWFVGLERQRNDDAYDPKMLETVANFLTLLTKNGDCESVTYRYGLAILRRRA